MALDNNACGLGFSSIPPNSKELGILEVIL